MILDYQWLETVGAWVLPVFLFDFLFTGISLRLIGMGGWYRGLLQGEEIVYRRRLGGRKRGWTWGGLVTITNKRVVVRYHLSQVTLVEIPVNEIREVVPERWWWFSSVRLVYRTKSRECWITIDTTRRNQSELLEAFRTIGTKVVKEHEDG